MIVVSDTTPLRYLAAIGVLDELPVIFGEVVCPPEVLTECRHARAPEVLRTWALSPPAWLRVVPVPNGAGELPSEIRLDAGETAAIRLARAIRSDLILLDERRGREVAAALGLSVTGTLGILVELALRDRIDFEQAVGRLTIDTNFRVGPAVIAAARQRLGGKSP